MKKRPVMVQDIDQPIFEEVNKTPKRFKWFILGLMALIILGGILVILPTNNQSRVQRKAKKVAVPTQKLSLTPTESASPAGVLRRRWQEIKNQFDSLEPQQNALQPPNLDFDLGIE